MKPGADAGILCLRYASERHQSAAEQTHIVEALHFELGKVEIMSIRNGWLNSSLIWTKA